MDNRRFSRQTILVLTKNSRLFQPVKTVIEKEGISVRFAGSVHEAAVAAILTSPALIAVELSPNDLSGLEIFSALEKLEGSGVSFRYFFYSFRESHHGFLHLYDQIHFLDEKGVEPVVEKINAILSIPPASWQRKPEKSPFPMEPPSVRDADLKEVPEVSEYTDAEPHPVQSGTNRATSASEVAGDSHLLQELDRLGVIRRK